MSWRAESTFQASSKLTDEEKDYLKLAKKMRDILKLEERARKGESLDKAQEGKVATMPGLLKEVAALAARLPGNTEVLEKNPDITELLPPALRDKVAKKREQEQARRQHKERVEEQERHRPTFQDHHTRPITDVVASADGRFLFTSAKDNYVLCWSMADRTLRVVCAFPHQGALWALDISPSPAAMPERLASGGADGKAMIWRVDDLHRASGAVRSRPEHTVDHGGIVRVLRWCPFDVNGDAQRFASATDKFTSTPPSIMVWRLTARGDIEQVMRQDNIPTKANDLRWGNGAKMKLFSAHDNGYVGVWLAEDPGNLLKTIKLHSQPVTCLALSRDNKTLISSSHDNTALAVDVSSPATEVVATYASNRPLNAVAVSTDYKPNECGFVVVAGGKDPKHVTTSKTLEDEFDCKFLDGETGEEVGSGAGHFGPVHALFYLAQSGSGGAFASVSEDGCIKVRGVDDGELLHSDTAM